MSDRNHDRAEDRAIEQAWSQMMAGGGQLRLSPADGRAAAALVGEKPERLGRVT